MSQCQGNISYQLMDEGVASYLLASNNYMCKFLNLDYLYSMRNQKSDAFQTANLCPDYSLCIYHFGMLILLMFVFVEFKCSFVL